MKKNQSETVYQKVRRIVKLEENILPDWRLISNLVDDLLKFITDNNIDGRLDEYVVKFLDDWEIRKNDQIYGDYQRKKILEVVDSAEIKNR